MYIFNAKLEDTDLNITRRFQVPDDFNVLQLGCTVVALFGFQGYHCLSVEVDGIEYDSDAYTPNSRRGNNTIPTIEDVFDTASCGFVSYDFGDGWVISVELEKHTEEQGDLKLISGTGRGCVEDVGGTGGLERFVAAFRDCAPQDVHNDDEDDDDDEDGYEDYDDDDEYEDGYEAMCSWQGITEYDWENCYVDKINERLESMVSLVYCSCVFDEDPFALYSEVSMCGGTITEEEIKEWYEEAFGVCFWSDED